MYVVSNGVTLNVDERGTGDPVLFLHGWMADSRVFAPLLSAIGPGRGLRAITLDLRGHGGSDKPPIGYGVEEQSRDVDAVLDACAVDRVTLVGWSLGGSVALHYAATRPDRVRRIALLAATPSLVRQPGFDAGTPAEAFTGLLGALRADFAPVSGQFVAAQLPERDAAVPMRVLLDCAAQTDGPTAAAVAEAVGFHDLREFAPRVTAPALVLHGALDTVVPPEAGRWLAEHLPKVDRHVEWPDLGHCPHLTAPSLVASELVTFC
jgi:pimeloyl-ACP methyl ester carboxylesterase